MLTSFIRLSVATLALGAAVSSFAGVAQARAADYRFEVLDPQVQPNREATEIRVRLVRLADGQPVTGAALEEARLGMWPVQLHKTVRPWMVHAVGLASAEGSGVYRLRAELTMIGDYRLALVAGVPGEVEPVEGAVRIRVAHR